jgi:putative nucleotidyltransferase with HDIG domain
MPADAPGKDAANSAAQAHGGEAAPAAPAAPTGASAIPFGAVTALTSALRYRDASTADHSQRVADLCVATAKDLMSVGDCFVLEVAALLHDIGKLGVPDAILLKPGPLSDEEWKTMRAHDRMGAEIVAAAFGSDELTGIVQAHHAWFGGSPRDPGLPTGHHIPLRARILSIADAYDAMTSDRVYRKGRGREEAFAELRRCAGVQFDPDLVERFIRVVTAADSGRSGKATEAELALARVQQQIERLGHALDARHHAAACDGGPAGCDRGAGRHGRRRQGRRRAGALRRGQRRRTGRRDKGERADGVVPLDDEPIARSTGAVRKSPRRRSRSIPGHGRLNQSHHPSAARVRCTRALSGPPEPRSRNIPAAR